MASDTGHNPYPSLTPSLSVRKDTLVKDTSYILGKPEQKRHMEQSVIRDLDEQTRTMNVVEFCKCILRWEDTRESRQLEKDAFLDMQKAGLYAQGCFVKFPQKANGREMHYYSPWVELDKALRDCPPLKRAVAALGYLAKVLGICVDTSAIAPRAVWKHKAKIRPDLRYEIAALNTDEDTAQAQIEEFKKETEESSCKTSNKRKRDEEDDLLQEEMEIDEDTAPPLTKEDLNLLKAHWLRTIVPVEIKPSGSVVDKEALVQLGTYLRSILREQQDRQFVMGLLLAHDELAILYCDRSGFISTVQNPINIHKDPILFIRVLSRLALMSPSDFGWDLSMKLVSDRIPEPTYSFDPKIQLRDLPTSAWGIGWEICIRNKLYRTIQPISTSRAEVMVGRANLVWLAFCIGEMDESSELMKKPVEPVKPVVIKQSWVPAESLMDEVDFYQKGHPSNFNELIVFEEKRNNTDTVFRQGLRNLKDIYYTFHPTLGRQGTDSIAEDKADERAVVMTDNNSTDPLFSDLWEAPSKFEPIPRVQHRIVQSFYGYPVKNFKDIRELLEAIFDAVSEYEQLYNNGVCHRDISPANIIIDSTTGRGRLIDLDHAKYAENYSPRTIAQTVQEDNGELMQMARDLQAHILSIDELIADDELAWAVVTMRHVKTKRKAIEVWCAGVPEDRIEELKEGKLGELPSTVSLADFDLPISKNTLLPPDYEGRLATNVIRTGAKAFMSSDFLRNPRSNTPAHSAIHDMDSFLQSLVYICLTREGPGGITIQDLEKRNPDRHTAERVLKSRQIKDTIRALFANPPNQTQAHKLEFLESQQERDGILALFSDYFEPVKPLIHRWATILHRGFERQSKKYDTLYTVYPIQLVKNAIRDAIKRLPDPTVSNRFKSLEDEVQKERKTKMEDIEKIMASLTKARYPAQEDVGAATESSSSAESEAVASRAITPPPGRRDHLIQTSPTTHLVQRASSTRHIAPLKSTAPPTSSTPVDGTEERETKRPKGEQRGSDEDSGMGKHEDVEMGEDNGSGEETDGDDGSGEDDDEDSGEETDGDNGSNKETDGDHASGEETGDDENSGDETDGDNDSNKETDEDEGSDVETDEDEDSNKESAEDEDSSKDDASKEADEDEEMGEDENENEELDADNLNNGGGSDDSMYGDE
ncbi:hypothetical protein D9613_005650 [Agrocybe pediades]|uniref:Protein kinase domain-containing protein n=1 Tax=Agrocybe pediades TaxID=84607 RepID=A0A8H4QW79_9AGAR|nr:hypothetical protein D9613_005650 [Agrocybe pediades]